MPEQPDTIRFYRGHLPHWEVYRGRYFVTVRLADTIPIHGVERIREYASQLKDLDPSEPRILHIRRRIFLEMERWLDRTSPVEYLRCPELANEVGKAIRHREENGTWTMFSYVVMPNHLHLFFRLGNDEIGSESSLELKSVMDSFKHWIAHAAKVILNLHGKPFWQREWFDHWSRSHQADERIIAYIRNNPVKAGFVNQAEDWPYVK